MKIKFLFAGLIAVVLIGATGCLSSRKNAEPKTNDISSQINENIVKKLLEDKYGQNKIQTVSIEQSAENHLRGSVNFQPLPSDLENGRGGEGAIFLATKVNGEWKLVFDGNGGIGCEEMKPYNFPSDMIADCYKEENEDKNSNIEAEGKMAEEAINKFFAYLSDKEYEKAVSLLMVSDEDWNEMANYTEEKDKNDKIKVLQNYCDAVKTCLKSKVLKTEFPFYVRKIDDDWKVASVPLYRP